MSQTTYCTNCGKEISITARFCRFCGTSIRRTSSEPTPSPEIRQTPRTQHSVPQPTRTFQAEPIEKIPDSIVDSLYARKRKDQIKDELKTLLKNIDDLDKKVEIGLIDESNSSAQSKQIQEKIESLQNEQETLKAQPLELEIFREEEKKWFERLEKIEEKNRANAVSKPVYESLKDEYSAELATTRRKRSTEERKAKRWLVDLQKEVRVLETKVESLKVRSEIEGQGSDDIRQKTESISKQRVKKASAAEILAKILQNS
ncbi:MAG: zinc-ribbon domain-containing protein [Candidatus Hodarchaeales archaeon]|jgi:DNA repair exonuclease SbcCD ATPase subunit